MVSNDREMKALSFEEKKLSLDYNLDEQM